MSEPRITRGPYDGSTESSDTGAAAWDFPGWGTAERIDDLDLGDAPGRTPAPGAKGKLGQWPATAICGNDITSSCLYVTALTAVYAGPYAPIALIAVAVVLFLYQRIYAEVGSALPLNGGAYNVLLNTSSKAHASVAACLTLLSYMATAVISAGEAMHYAHNLWGELPVMGATACLLGFFAVLSVTGMRESAGVALVLFIAHIATLLVLLVCMGGVAIGGGEVLRANLSMRPSGGAAAAALFFGFSAGMLGISGFESSANFIEEQQPGVFPKTLRNMWLAVAIINPLISGLSLCVVPLGAAVTHRDDLLAHLGFVASGPMFQKIVSIDAALVLSGAVLTSYVGVTGLMRRMALDRCLPQFLLLQNRSRGTNHWIVLAFLLSCVSVLAITHGNVATLAGVYTLSFLGVMGLFAVGNMLLKVKRRRLPRSVRASWPAVSAALIATAVAVTGNVLLDPHYVRIWAVYFACTMGGIAVMLQRVWLLKTVLVVTEGVVSQITRANTAISDWIVAHIRGINSRTVVFFTKGDDIAVLNQAAVYVLGNEQNKRLTVVHCFEREEDIPAQLADDMKALDRIHPDIRMDLLLVRGRFGPQLIERLSQRLGVPENYMLIGTPGDRFPHNIAELGGVRLIM